MPALYQRRTTCLQWASCAVIVAMLPRVSASSNRCEHSGRHWFDAIQRMPYPTMQKLADEFNPDNAHNYWRSTFLKELSDEVIDLIIERANRSESPLANTIIQLYRGAMSSWVAPIRRLLIAKRDTTLESRRRGLILPRATNTLLGRAPFRRR
jgi:hypothetical protein